MNASERTTIYSLGKTERIKILFQYLLMLILPLIMGVLLPSFLSEEAKANIFQTVAQHFKTPFSQCQTLSDALRWITEYSKPSWILIGISCLFTFSVLNYVASDLVLAYIGFQFGFSASILYRLVGQTAEGIFITPWQGLAFVIFKLLIVLCLLIYSFLLPTYSYRLKQYHANGRTSFHFETLLSFLVCTILFGGLIFALNTFYCWIIFCI